jgi:DNA invertase Pin-like site-specific DNA recombinase
MARPHPRTIASLRVSTHEPEVAKHQTDMLRRAHRQQLGQVQVVEETVSGRVPGRRRKMAQVLDTLEAGATLGVSALSRLGRSRLDCLEILALATQKGLHLHAVKGDWQLDGSMPSTSIARACARAAESAREWMAQRPREA